MAAMRIWETREAVVPSSAASSSSVGSRPSSSCSFIAMRRIDRGHYEMEFVPLAAGDESLPPGALTERYAQLVERQIRAAPPDWPWSHKRWKLKRSLYQSRNRATS